MDSFITWVHIFTCFFIIITVLLQSGKGAAIGSTFGGASQTVFGASGSTSLLTKFTTFFAIVFMCTSLYLTYYSIHLKSDSVMDSMKTIQSAPKEAGAEAPVPVTAEPVTAPVESITKGEEVK